MHKVPEQITYTYYADWIAPAVQLQLQTYDDKFEIHGRYRGKPRPELEAAWADYVRRKSTLIYFPSHCSFNTSTDYTLRVPKPGWANATPDAILTEFQDEQGGIMGTFSYIHNIHCLVCQIALRTTYSHHSAYTYRKLSDNGCFLNTIPKRGHNSRRPQRHQFLDTLVSASKLHP
jgi:hypothetical protein